MKRVENFEDKMAKTPVFAAFYRSTNFNFKINTHHTIPLNMRNTTPLIYLPLLTLLLLGCNLLKKTTGGKTSRNSTRGVEVPVQYSTTGDRNQDYVTRFKDAAVMEMERGGVPASIILAQGVLESGAGFSDLAQNANNHFGVKCGGSWKGASYYKLDDDKDKDGNPVESCFRKYASVNESFFDHGEFLRDPKKQHRYGWLFNLDRTDYKAWAKGLQSSGYATNPNYADRLIDLIERYRLYEFDRPGGSGQTLPPGTQPIPSTNPSTAGGNNGNSNQPNSARPNEQPTLPAPGAGRIQRVNDVKVVLSKEGETLEDIANAYKLNYLKVADYNDRGYVPGVRLRPNTRIFIQPKKDKWHGSASDHVVREGQTMFDIAQNYGMKLEKLRDRNRMKPGEEPATGEKLCLRGTRPKNMPVKLRDLSKNPVKPGTTTPTTPTTTTGNQPKMTPNNDDVLFEIGGDGKTSPTGQPSNTGTTTNPNTTGRPATTGTTFPDDPVPNSPGNNNTNTNNNTNNNNNNNGNWNGSWPSTPNNPPATNPNTPTVPPGAGHLVVKGDTLYSIARKYSITVARLKQLNNLPDDNIKIGQTLRVK